MEINNMDTVNSEAKCNLFARDKLLSKTSDNMERAEAAIDETPLRTSKTEELEKRE